MSQIPAYASNPHINRSLLLSTLKPSQRYKVARKNKSVSESNQIISHSKLLDLCSVKNYEELDDTAVKLENKKLRFALKQINEKLTYRVQRKKLRIQAKQSSTIISMKDLMEYVPKDIEEERRKNLEILQEINKELQGCLARRKVLSSLQYRTNLENQTHALRQQVNQILQNIRTVKRKMILTEKQIKVQEKYNQGEGYFSLRREVMATTKCAQETEDHLVEVEMENNRVLQKLLIVTEKQSLMKMQYLQIISQEKQLKDKLLHANESNEIYLQNLTRLKNSKRRYNTTEEMYKVKYYSALKKLDIESQRHSKVDDQIRQIEYQIFLKKQLAERLTNKMNQKKRRSSYFEDDDLAKGFMITELHNQKRIKRQISFKPSLSKTINSEKNCSCEDEHKCQSAYY